MKDRSQWPGARWWKVDFHAHTPASTDYGKGARQAELRERTPEDWILDYMRAGIDCVVVTDHNLAAWVDPLKRVLQELETANHPEYRPLYLFPGVEVSVHGGVHVLAVFDLHVGSSHIDSFLGAVHYRGEKGNCDGCTEDSLVQVVDNIARAGGLVIPAHVDEAAGLFQMQGITLGQVLDCCQIFAIELCTLASPKPGQYLSKKIHWTEVLGSDAHHPRGAKSPGSHFTWVKMGSPNLEGLRLALLDGPLSIRRSDTAANDPNAHGSYRVEGLSVESARYIGRGAPVECQFNPWLSAIIGGRGTGKSTLVEFLRLVMRRDKEIPDTLKTEFAKYQEVYASREDDGLLTAGTKLVARCTKDDAKFRIQWSYDGHVTPIEEEAGDGTWQVAQGDIRQRFPIRIYSQKQVFELARHPQALLRIIDEAPELRFREWQEKWMALETRFLSLRALAREIGTALGEEPRLRGELDDVRRRLATFEAAGHTEILKEYQRRQRQRRTLESWQEGWRHTGNQIRELAAELRPGEPDPSFFSSENENDARSLADAGMVAQQFGAICEKLEALAREADLVARGWEDTKAGASWFEAMNQAIAKYEALRKQLAEADAGDPGEYGHLVQQRQAVEERLRDFDAQKRTLDRLQREAEACLDDLQQHRRELTSRRAAFLDAVLRDNFYVSINVLPYGNRESVEEELRIRINRGQGGFERDIGTVDGKEGLLAALYADALPSVRDPESSVSFEQRLRELKEAVRAIREGRQNAIQDHRFAGHVRNLPPENLDRLDCWFPQDSLEVLYSAQPGEDLKPVHQGSPGQKTAALLAFLLSYGEEPLVLDQPEDDLDNHLIYDLIVTQLRTIKQRRQVIVVTHNPNIVVNGDAEMVIALDARGGQTHRICEGSLQQIDVREEICRVMEGGKEAFDLRYQRITAGVQNV